MTDSNLDARRPDPTYQELVFRSDWLKHRGARYHEYRRLWDEAPRSMTFPPFPLNVDIEPNTTCDMLCPMCDRTILMQKEAFNGRQVMSDAEYEGLVDQCAAMGTYAIKFASLGEPLMHPRIGRLIAYAKSQGIEDMILNTNGTLLGRKGEEILEAGVDKVHVSFDSPYEAEYASIRVGGDFHRNYENVVKFCELRNRKYPRTHVRVSMVIFDDSPDTARKIDDMAHLFRDHVDALGMTTALDYADKSVKPHFPGFRCGQLTQRICLEMSGVVTMCCWHVGDEYPIGDWRKDRLIDIWNGERLRRIRDKHVRGEYYDIDVCKRCAMVPAQYCTTQRELDAVQQGKGVLGAFAENLMREGEDARHT